jgi:hypothetical protein
VLDKWAGYIETGDMGSASLDVPINYLDVYGGMSDGIETCCPEVAVWRSGFGGFVMFD